MKRENEQWFPEYINTGFVAKRCGVSSTTVLRWIEKGQLPAFRLPSGHYRIVREDFAEFLTNYSITAPDSASIKNRDIHRKT